MRRDRYESLTDRLRRRNTEASAQQRGLSRKVVSIAAIVVFVLSFFVGIEFVWR